MESPYSKPYSLPCLSQLYWVACWFGHLPKDEIGEFKVLQPYQINNHHRECRTNTHEWWYDGGSGRYTRDITLPSLMNLCEEQHRTMHVCIYILDPRDENVCRMYATYSNLVTPGNVVTQANVNAICWQPS